MYYLLGKTLKHSISTEIHERLGAYSYELLEMGEEDLQKFFEKREFEGLNVTIPYKIKVIPYLDELCGEGKTIGVVNTVVNRGGKLIGYNTDYYGFERMLKHNNVDAKEQSVAILGNGGVAKTVEVYFKNNGAKSIEVFSHKDIDLGVKTNAEIIVNCTPVGKYGWEDKSPVDFENAKGVKVAIDLIYNPYNTRFLRGAKAKGAKTINGLYMLIAQAKKASELFTGNIIDDDIIDTLYDDFKMKRQNIVIIGMGGAGKSTVGKAIANATKMDYIDTDELIKNKVQMSTKDYILTRGEDEFRMVEREVISELSDIHGFVISTGGGVPIFEQNMDTLRRNGVIVFLDTPLSMLDKDRPLYKSEKEVQKLYDERISKYRDADILINNDYSKNIDEITKEIIDETFGY